MVCGLRVKQRIFFKPHADCGVRHSPNFCAIGSAVESKLIILFEGVKVCLLCLFIVACSLALVMNRGIKGWRVSFIEETLQDITFREGDSFVNTFPLDPDFHMC